MDNPAFWSALEQLIAKSEMVIDRPKGSRHPRYPDLVYEVDYGYLKDTASMDGGGIDIWRGTAGEQRLLGMICTVDLHKRDSEIKLLIGLTEEETEKVFRFHNDSPSMKGILIIREKEETKGS